MAVPRVAPTSPKRRRRLRRTIAIIAAALVVAGMAVYAGITAQSRASIKHELDQAQARVTALQEQVRSLSTEGDALRSQAAASEPRLAELQSQLEAATAELDTLRERAANASQEEGGTAALNGKDVTVELTGYEDVLDIHDVRLTHAYGFSDLIGIAVNKSGKTITYAQLGCTFLDGKGRVVSNVIDNREKWPAGASWGFDCSAEVDATGGIVRVDSAA